MQAGHTPQTNLIEPSSITLINADGRKLTPLGTTTAKLDLEIMTVNHTLIVVEKLSTPVILGCDFLTKHGIILDFNTGTFNTATSAQEGKIHLSSTHSCMSVLDDDHPEAMPSKATSSLPGTLDMPTEYHPALRQVLQDYAMLFKSDLGRTTVAEHVIETGHAAPVRVPPRPIPFHYAERVHKQLEEMAQEGIIRRSNSPWSAPAVYVPKNNGEIRICVDFIQLNKVTKKDAYIYPVPRAEGPQQRLSNKRVFSKIDLRECLLAISNEPRLY